MDKPDFRKLNRDFNDLIKEVEAFNEYFKQTPEKLGSPIHGRMIRLRAGLCALWHEYSYEALGGQALQPESDWPETIG